MTDGNTRRRWPGALRAVLPLALLVLSCSYAADTRQNSLEDTFERARQEYESGHYFDAVLQFSDFIREHPGSVLVDQAIYYRGLSYFGQKDWIMASTDFARVVGDFPESKYVCESQFKLAETYWRQSRKAQYDQHETLRAMEEFERFMARCPHHELAAEVPEFVARARDRLAEKLYQGSVIYRKLGKEESALIYLGLVIDDYSDTRWATRARQDRAMQLIKLQRINEARADIEWLNEYDAGTQVLDRAFQRAEREESERRAEQEEGGDGGRDE